MDVAYKNLSPRSQIFLRCVIYVLCNNANAFWRIYGSRNAPRAVAVLGKNIWGQGAWQRRLSEITIEPIKNLGASGLGKIWGLCPPALA